MKSDQETERYLASVVKERAKYEAEGNQGGVEACERELAAHGHERTPPRTGGRKKAVKR